MGRGLRLFFLPMYLKQAAQRGMSGWPLIVDLADNDGDKGSNHDHDHDNIMTVMKAENMTMMPSMMMKTVTNTIMIMIMTRIGNMSRVESLHWDTDEQKMMMI